MTKVQRRVIADGEYFQIACAVVADGVTSPAATVLDELETGWWQDPEAEELPDEYQPRLRTRLLAHIKALAETGDLPPGAYNRLDAGVWELKVEGVRMTFYDTDGAGGWAPKQGQAVSTWQGTRRWELPDDFDEFLRLGHTFAKTGQKTSKPDLQRSQEIRVEDVNHDQEREPVPINGGAGSEHA